jgi:hypothetical protein
MSITKKLLKYIITFIVLYISIVFITKSKINKYDSIAISLVGTSTYALIDQYAPSYIIEEKN